MTTPEKCSASDCPQLATASLNNEPLCREHFIFNCYTRLDRYDEIRNGPGFAASDVEYVRRFIHECTRQADAMEQATKGVDNLDRAKLLHIILSANELGRHLRRSPRKFVNIPVKLCSERLGGSWEEETETVLVSRYGALVRCNHAAKAGETIQVTRGDTGASVTARVAWQRPVEQEQARIGVEFVGCENFWELDWAAVEEAH
jgi:hypothetical protein